MNPDRARFKRWGSRSGCRFERQLNLPGVQYRFAWLIQKVGAGADLGASIWAIACWYQDTLEVDPSHL
ncbi:hypothetical protein L227DRAFT_285188 [Lentinus tigrinus ALCF2SS1-6]|uniref:Uncharacterized protein n=1 Tax=Lentinus tigrinus ALCF2SS1-6 TaxID=1328759 RepID=A0A5C2RZC6_9APHY|nr:hypothetical protein L227DRAFT_285188 [Lentinus tigrinus ALCF2SS1-6]